MKQNIFKSTKEQYRNTMAVLAMMTLSGSAFADGATTTSKGGIGNVKDACGQVSGFFSNNTKHFAGRFCGCCNYCSYYGWLSNCICS